MTHWFADIFVVAETEVANAIYVWASFLLPAAILMFVYAWDQLALLQ